VTPAAQHGGAEASSIWARPATSGKATTSIDHWNLNADRVGAPWLVDRDGTIYQTFNDSAWIFHLGLKGVKGLYDKQSVAIEFANEGPLELDGDKLYAFCMNTPNTRYTGESINFDCRGFSYFAQMDEAQVDAGIALTLDICQRHKIEPVFYYPSTTFDFPRCFQVATIICHSNCRADKTDLCLPQWVFEKIEAASASPHEGVEPWTSSFGYSTSRCATFRLHAAAPAARRSARICASRSLASTKSSTASARNEAGPARPRPAAPFTWRHQHPGHLGRYDGATMQSATNGARLTPPK
jgi:hypothetical protein